MTDSNLYNVYTTDPQTNRRLKVLELAPFQVASELVRKYSASGYSAAVDMVLASEDPDYFDEG